MWILRIEGECSTSQAHGHFARVGNRGKGQRYLAPGWQKIEEVFQMPAVVYDVILILRVVKDEIGKTALACGSG